MASVFLRPWCGQGHYHADLRLFASAKTKAQQSQTDQPNRGRLGNIATVNIKVDRTVSRRVAEGAKINVDIISVKRDTARWKTKIRRRQVDASKVGNSIPDIDQVKAVKGAAGIPRPTIIEKCDAQRLVTDIHIIDACIARCPLDAGANDRVHGRDIIAWRGEIMFQTNCFAVEQCCVGRRYHTH